MKNIAASSEVFVANTDLNELLAVEKRLTLHASLSVFVLLALLLVGAFSIVPWLMLAPPILACVGVMGSLGIQLNQLENSKFPD